MKNIQLEDSAVVDIEEYRLERRTAPICVFKKENRLTV
jgi:hypothetical protein